MRVSFAAVSLLNSEGNEADGDYIGSAYLRGVSSHHFSSTYTRTTYIFIRASEVFYADNISITIVTDFIPIEETLTSAVHHQPISRVSLFHMRYCECVNQLNISWRV